uniref:Chromosome 17 C20orf173 homolog n=2 Tax=Sus scrofa TaxID=9823 RepID=A0A5G2QHD3_PIG
MLSLCPHTFYPRPSGVLFREPGRGAVSYQTLEPSPGPDMKRSWQIFVLWVFWVFILWLMVPCLDPKHEWAPQEKWINMVPWRCCCPWFKCRISGYPSRTLNYSLCHDTVRRDQFDAGNQKMKGYLMGAAESTSPNAVLWWLGMHSASELGKVWKKLLEAIPRPSVSHLHLFCGSCALTGNSKILRATSLHSNVNQYSVVSRNARDQGSWRQLLLLLPKLFDLAWTSDVLSEEILEDGPVP